MRTSPMRSLLAPTILIGLCALAPSAWAAIADNEYTLGHGDIGIGYDADSGEWDLHWHIEGGTVNGTIRPDEEFETDDLYARVPDTTIQIRPFGSQWDFIGVAAGEPFYRLPQGAIAATLEQAPFLGLATEEIDPGVFVGNLINLELTNVIGPAGGIFSLYQDGPTPFLVNIGDNFAFPTGVHDHFNYGFSLPGVYMVELTASGILNDGFNTFTSGSAFYAFAVGDSTTIPEPGSGLLVAAIGLGAGGFWWRRRRKTIPSA